MKRRVAILASGRGSNAAAMVEYFKGHESIEISVIASNKKEAGVLDMASEEGISNFSFTKAEMNAGALGDKLSSAGVEFVLLCGFLLRVPPSLISRFEGRMLNIHPSLLPKFGGKGMYGMNVHQAVLEAGEEVSGISIHKVTENYDEGAIVFQGEVDVKDATSPEEIASRVLALEHKYYPTVAEAMIKESLWN